MDTGVAFLLFVWACSFRVHSRSLVIFPEHKLQLYLHTSAIYIALLRGTSSKRLVCTLDTENVLRSNSPSYTESNGS